MNWTASSYFIPHSIRARATRTGALQGHPTFRPHQKTQPGRNNKAHETFYLKYTLNDTQHHVMRSFLNKSSAMIFSHSAPDQEWWSMSTWQSKAHLPSPATQWTAMQQPGSSLNFNFSRFSQSSTIWLEGGAPSSNGQSWWGTETRKSWCLQFIRNQKKRSSCCGGGQLGDLSSCFLTAPLRA